MPPYAVSRARRAPCASEAERAYVLAALEAVDAVTVFEQDTPLEIDPRAPSRRAREGRRLHARHDRRRDAKSNRGADACRSSRSPQVNPPPASSRRFVPAPERYPRASDARSTCSARVTLERGASPYAEGSCLITCGNTRVLCTASVEDGVPAWRRGRGEGWMTAEYAMLPRATHTRTSREREQDRRSHAGDSAPHRTQPSRDARRLQVRRVHDQGRLRRAAGGWRHAHGVDHRRVRGGRRRVRLARAREEDRSVAREASRGRGERRHHRWRAAARSRLRGGRARRGRHERRDDAARGSTWRCRARASTAPSIARRSTGCSDSPTAASRRCYARRRMRSRAMSGTSCLLATRSLGKLYELRPMFAARGPRRDRSRRGGHPRERRRGRDSRSSIRSRRTRSPRRGTFARASGLVTIADDSGLEVAGTRRRARRAHETVERAHGSRRTRARCGQQRVPVAKARTSTDRRARYVCVAALVDGSGQRTFRGETEGEILETPRGEGGFGYDPLFLSSDLGITFAEAERAVKERESHRGRAFAQLIAWLRTRAAWCVSEGAWKRVRVRLTRTAARLVFAFPGRSVAWYRACFGSRRSPVQIRSPRSGGPRAGRTPTCAPEAPVAQVDRATAF